jgi:UDP-N-acetylglucosamine:LPS N-acetylglucosamine transferase
VRGMSGEAEVLLFMIDAGGGHRAAARALAAAAEATRAPFRLRVTNYQQILLALDPLHKLTGVSVEDAYNLILRRRWNAALVPLMRLMHGVIRLRRRAIVRLVIAWLAERPRPAAVVSVMPNFNGIMADALHAAHPGVPLVVVLTDFADFPPRFWIEPGIDRVVVGSDEAREQAIALGIAPDRVSRASGMILRPGFYRSSGPVAREHMRAELGLGGDDFAVMLLFGGKGSPEMPRLADALLAADPSARVVAVCGDNPALIADMAAIEARSSGRLTALGFTDRIAELLAASDLLVTKPGPGSLAEAFHAHVPVVVTRNRHTIPQERFNTDFVKRHGLGLVVHDWTEIPDAVARLRADPAERTAIRARIAALPANRAVYEVLETVAREAGLSGGTSLS